MEYRLTSLSGKHTIRKKSYYRNLIVRAIEDIIIVGGLIFGLAIVCKCFDLIFKVWGVQ